MYGCLCTQKWKFKNLYKFGSECEVIVQIAQVRAFEWNSVAVESNPT